MIGTQAVSRNDKAGKYVVLEDWCYESHEIIGSSQKRVVCFTMSRATSKGLAAGTSLRFSAHIWGLCSGDQRLHGLTLNEQ